MYLMTVIRSQDKAEGNKYLMLRIFCLPCPAFRLVLKGSNLLGVGPKWTKHT